MKNLLLVDDHVFVRAGFKRLIESVEGFRVAAEASDADEAYKLICEFNYDLLIIDLNLRNSSGLDLIRRTLSRRQNQAILVLSMHDHPSYVTQAVRAGALGYITKDSEPSEVLSAIFEVLRGNRMLSQRAQVVLAHAKLTEGQTMVDKLSPKEFDVFRLMVSGFSHQEIAETLHLSSKTISNYMTSIRQKLDADSDMKLLRLALQQRLCTID